MYCISNAAVLLREAASSGVLFWLSTFLKKSSRAELLALGFFHALVSHVHPVHPVHLVPLVSLVSLVLLVLLASLVLPVLLASLVLVLAIASLVASPGQLTEEAVGLATAISWLGDGRIGSSFNGCYSRDSRCKFIIIRALLSTAAARKVGVVGRSRSQALEFTNIFIGTHKDLLAVWSTGVFTAVLFNCGSIGRIVVAVLVLLVVVTLALLAGRSRAALCRVVALFFFWETGRSDYKRRGCRLRQAKGRNQSCEQKRKNLHDV
jgi:hypothetical protein